MIELTTCENRETSAWRSSEVQWSRKRATPIIALQRVPGISIGSTWRKRGSGIESPEPPLSAATMTTTQLSQKRMPM